MWEYVLTFETTKTKYNIKGDQIRNDPGDSAERNGLRKGKFLGIIICKGNSVGHPLRVLKPVLEILDLHNICEGSHRNTTSYHESLISDEELRRVLSGETMSTEW